MSERFVSCEAGCHAIGAIVTQHEDDGGAVYLGFYVGAFYAGQESFLSRWRRRLAIAATALRGRDFEFEDIVLSGESAQQLAAALEGRKS